MNILFLRSNAVKPDPRVEKEISALKSANYDITVFAWDRSCSGKNHKSELEIDEYTVPIERCKIASSFGGSPISMAIPLIRFQFKIMKYLIKNRKNYDTIHACDFDTGFTALIFAKLFRKKLVYDIFDFYVDAFAVPNFLKGIIRFLDHIIINNANVVIICTEQRKQQIAKAKPKNLKVIYNTPPIINAIESTFELSKEKIKVVYIGILSESRLIIEMAQAISTMPDFELHVAGFGLLESKLISFVNSSDNIFFYNSLPYEKTLELESACDIMTAIYDPNIANHKYAAPNKFYEALMLGKPVIVCENTSIDKVVNKYEIGAVIDYNIDQFKLALLKLKSEKNNWELVSQKMKRLYKEQYSWGKYAQLLVSLYDEL